MPNIRILSAMVVAIGVLHSPSILSGQANWTYGSDSIYAPLGTNVGVGGAPLLNFDVIGRSGQSDIFRIRSDYSNPTFVFQNNSGSSTGGGSMSFRTGQGTFASPAAMVKDYLLGQSLFYGHDGASYTLSSGIRAKVDGIVSTGVVPGRIEFWTAPLAGGAWREVMRINADGNVGIGTTSPQNKLSVNGIIQAKEVLVNTGWSDYVFAPNYRLSPLKEVAAYIKEHHHLPEIPTEAEVQQHGVSLGEMQAKLLAKIEELTLHMIQADEQNIRLEGQNRNLQERIARLEAAGGSAGAAKPGI
jgi:hypothetical protein